jgi:hypothetical protein
VFAPITNGATEHSREYNVAKGSSVPATVNTYHRKATLGCINAIQNTKIRTHKSGNHGFPTKFWESPKPTSCCDRNRARHRRHDQLPAVRAVILRDAIDLHKKFPQCQPPRQKSAGAQQTCPSKLATKLFVFNCGWPGNCIDQRRQRRVKILHLHGYAKLTT